MRHTRFLPVAAIALLAASFGMNNAHAAGPVQNPSSSSAEVTQVQWRGKHWDYRNHHHGWRHGHWRSRSWGPALGGFAAGAAIGGAIANSRAQALENDAYCSQRYRSYDPRSGTYLGYDGQRHPCP